MCSCNLPPALLAEWPGTCSCYCGNTGVERIPNYGTHPPAGAAHDGVHELRPVKGHRHFAVSGHGGVGEAVAARPAAATAAVVRSLDTPKRRWRRQKRDFTHRKAMTSTKTGFYTWKSDDVNENGFYTSKNDDVNKNGIYCGFSVKSTFVIVIISPSVQRNKYAWLSACRQSTVSVESKGNR